MEKLLYEAIQILPPGQILVVLLLSFLIRLVIQVRDQFRVLNGSVREIKIQIAAHEQYDRERFEALERVNISQWSVIEKLRTTNGKIG